MIQCRYCDSDDIIRTLLASGSSALKAAHSLNRKRGTALVYVGKVRDLLESIQTVDDREVRNKAMSALLDLKTAAGYMSLSEDEELALRIARGDIEKVRNGDNMSSDSDAEPAPNSGVQEAAE